MIIMVILMLMQVKFQAFVTMILTNTNHLCINKNFRTLTHDLLKILSSSQKTFFRLLAHNVAIHNIMGDHHTTTTKKIRNEFSSRP